ncbi:two-component regulator propeller domain-containing protein [Algoriphagus aquimarinus]|uniref:two-component regulator propeller domain-containing protein n=1 Tax=Algoriphagus aquimarinus TaxID=237018 RepID=UPI0030DA0549|tara:strand:+ start:115249 stop:119322 length:4074 start_codon:yes stop_codon:yes gene_type:complete
MTLSKSFLAGFLSLCIVILLASIGYAQEKRYYFRHYDVTSGLTDNSVFAIFQDSQGFMWFGTKDGLSRFDGTSWKNYNSDSKGPKEETLGNSFVYFITESKDSTLWIGTAEGVYLFDRKKEKFTHFSGTTADGNKIEGTISSIAMDQSGNMWIASYIGLFRYNSEHKKLELFSHDPAVVGSLPQGNVNTVKIDERNEVWAAITGRGVVRYIPASSTFVHFIDEENRLATDVVQGLQDWGEFIIIGTKTAGIKKLEKSTGRITEVLSRDENGSPIFVREMFPISKTELGIGTESGLFIYDFVKKSYQHLQENHNDPNALSNNAIYSIWKDMEGGLWVGTYFGGVNYLPNQPTKFDAFYPIADKNTITGMRVREIVGAPDGKIWIGTEDAGLNLFDPKTDNFQHFPVGKSNREFSYHNIHGLAQRGDELWAGTFSQGLNVLNTKTGIVRKYSSKTPNSGLHSDDFFAILVDSKERIWLGSTAGLFLYDDAQDSFRHIPEIEYIFIYDMLEDSNGLLWLATYNNGLISYDPVSGEKKSFLPEPNNPKSLLHHSVVDVFLDTKQQIWVATSGGGFAKYDNKTNSFTSYTLAKGFPTNTYYNIVEDDQGLLWITSNKGLLQFDPGKETFKLYNRKNGLMASGFNYQSGYKSKDGTLYFGSLDGFITFKPSLFETYTYQPRLAFTGIQLFNQEIPITTDGILRKAITYTEKITLNSDQNSLSFDVASLGYTNAINQNIRYRMAGFEKEWQSINDSQKIFYSYLPPGEYELIVQSHQNVVGANTQEARLKLEILPPFYKSTLAYVIYLVLTVLIIYWLITMYKNRVTNRHLVQINLLEAEKEKELYEAKIEFFTNITHEIRTPLTLIKGPLEDILSKDRNCDQEVKNDLLIIEKNTNRLIDLSNQLLDFRKTEQRGFKLSFLKTEICGILDELYVRFKVTAAQSGLNFTLGKSTSTLFADVDKEAIIKILSNLLVNALKNAESMIHIRLTYDPTHPSLFHIEISNDGDLIPREMAEKIFEPFFQISDTNTSKAKQGTGLGLPLAKSLAEMHHGSLTITNDHELNRFVLELPIKQEEAIHFEEENETWVENKVSEDQDEIVSESIKPKKKGSLPAILLVEDNKELLQFLGQKLKGKYVVHKAENGLLALEVLKKEPIDLVISDVMMPVMDGYKLCEHIKADLATSHIPVVLLTAKNNINAKITGLEMGADVYLEKPFSLEFLYLQIKNLLQHRDQIKKAFASLPLVNSDTIAHTKADEEFLSKINEAILANIENELFGVSELADQLNMSQSSLLRKIKGISELTPNGYIRLVRLKKSAELLSDGLHSIAEISEMVGFNSPSYFTKCFQKHFGELPKDFGKKQDVL